MKLYDLTYFLSPDLTQEQQKKVTEAIISLIEKEGGVLNEQTPLTLKKLAYPIKKYTSGLFGTIKFYVLPEKIKTILNKLRTQENMLRYLLSRVELEPVQPQKLGQAPEKTQVKTEIKKAIKPPKVELEKLEEKLEELLKE